MYAKSIGKINNSEELGAVIYEERSKVANKRKKTKNKEKLNAISLNYLGKDSENVLEKSISITEKIVKGRNGDIKLRLYRNLDVKNDIPAIIVLHGGTFTNGSLENCDKFCKVLCEKSQSLIVNVDYRLAPEHQFPEGLFDCYDSIRYIYENAKRLGVNREKIAVCGENAGGNMATACSMIEKDLKVNRIKLQILISPEVYLDNSSYKDYKFDINLYGNKDNEKWIKYIENVQKYREEEKYSYMGTNEFIVNQYASPLCAPSLKGIADTIIITGEDDYLRLQDESYFRKLEKNDVKCKKIDIKGYCDSIFKNIEVSDKSYEICVKIADEINKRFN